MLQSIPSKFSVDFIRGRGYGNRLGRGPVDHWPAPTQYPYSVHAVSTQYPHSAHTVHTQCPHSAHAVTTQCPLRAQNSSHAVLINAQCI